MPNFCACMGPQDDDLHCPCVMRSKGLEPSNQWTQAEKHRLNEALNKIFKWRKDESSSLE